MGKGKAKENKEKVKEESLEHCHQLGALHKDLGRQRLAQLGVLPNGAGPKAPTSRASVPILLLK